MEPRPAEDAQTGRHRAGRGRSGARGDPHVRRWRKRLGRLLAGLVVAAALLAGGVSAEARALLHLVAAVGAMWLLRTPAPAVASLGRTSRVAVAGALLVVPAIVGLIPLPRAALAVLSPANVAARPDETWWTLSIDPERTVSALALTTLAWAAAVFASAWWELGGRRRTLEAFVVAALGGLCVIGGVHAWSGTHELFGFVPIHGLRTDDRLFAPFINANHFGSALLLLLPVAFGAARDELAGDSMWRFVYVPVVLLAVGMLVAIGSFGVWTAALGALLLALVPRRFGWPGRAAVLGVFVAGGAAASVAYVRAAETDVMGASKRGRFLVWQDVVAMLPNHGPFGAGAGTFAVAFPPFRTFRSGDRFAHAHNEYLEVAVETGLVGLLAIGAAVWWLGRSTPDRDEALASRLSLGVAAVALHALVDFPFRIPALLLGAAAFVGVRYALGPVRAPESPAPLRIVAGALVALQVLGCVWQLRAAFVADALAVVGDVRTRPVAAAKAADTLRTIAPWRPEIALHAAASAEARGDRPAAAEVARGIVVEHPDDARALEAAALVLGRAGAYDEAEAALLRAIERDPNDYRAWELRSRLARGRGDDLAAAELWAEALRRWPVEFAPDGAPVRAGWEILPVAVWWLHALEDAPSLWSAALCRILLEEGDGEMALAAYDQADRMRPGVYRYQGLKTRALVLAGRHAEAEAFALEVLAERPDAAGLWQSLATVYEAQGRWADASEAWTQAFELSTERRDAFAVLALQHRERADGPEAALRLLSRFELYVQKNTRLGLEAARLQLAAGRPGSCLDEIERRRLLTDAAVGAEAEKLRATCASQRRSGP